MPLTDLDKGLGLAFLQYVESLRAGNEDKAEQLEVLAQLTGDFFGVSTSGSDVANYGVGKSLPKIFDTQWSLERGDVTTEESDRQFAEFLEKLKEKKYFDGAEEGSADYADRVKRARAKFDERAAAKFAGKTADELKDLGNAAIREKKYKDAVQFYTKAIQQDGANAVYWCNRAAAYTHLKMYNKAVIDARQAVAVQPDYVKAYNRLGTALFHLDEWDEAIAAFEKACELDPANEAYPRDVESVKRARAAAKGGLTPAAPAGGMPAGFPFPGGMPGMPGMPNMPGMPDIGSMMNQMMSNPEMMQSMMQMMANPQMQDMMGKMMGAMGMSDMPPMGGMPNPFGGDAAGAGADAVQTPFGALSREKFEAVRAKMFEHPVFTENPTLRDILSDGGPSRNPMEVFQEMSKHPEVFTLFQQFTEELFGGQK